MPEQRKQEVTRIVEEAEGVIVLCKTEQIYFVGFVWFCGLPDGLVILRLSKQSHITSLLYDGS